MKFHKSIIYMLLMGSLIVPCYSQDYLEPMNPYSKRTPYDRLLYEILVRNNPKELWMIASPSFQLEYAVILCSSKNDTTTYWIKHTVPKEKISYSVEYKGGGEWEIGTNLAIQVTESEAIISEEFAQLIKETWNKILKQPRYPDEPRYGRDGTQYQLYSRGESYNRYFGEIWSPNSGRIKIFIEFVNTLGEIPQSSSLEEKKKLIEKCYLMAKELNEFKEIPNQRVDFTVKTRDSKSEVLRTESHP